MGFNLQVIANLLTAAYPILKLAVDKIFNSTTVDEKAKEVFGKFAEASNEAIDKTMEAIKIAEENRNPVTDGLVFKFGRMLKAFTTKANGIVAYIEENFGEIDLDPSKY